MARKNYGKGDVSWYIPGGKRPIAYSTICIRDIINDYSTAGLTFQEAYERRGYCPEAREILHKYIRKGFGDTAMNRFFGG